MGVRADKKKKLKRAQARATAQRPTKQQNPFELKVNRQKHVVLGRKVKGATGNRAHARDQDIRIRNETIRVELERRGKANEFRDRRIGEYDKVCRVHG
jgi:nucleolar protein 14